MKAKLGNESPSTLNAVSDGVKTVTASAFFENRIDEPSEINREPDRWLSTNEAAQYLRISAASLRNKTSNGKVPYFKFGRLNRYRVSDLEQILLSKRRGGFL